MIEKPHTISGVRSTVTPGSGSEGQSHRTAPRYTDRGGGNLDGMGCVHACVLSNVPFVDPVDCAHFCVWIRVSSVGTKLCSMFSCQPTQTLHKRRIRKPTPPTWYGLKSHTGVQCGNTAGFSGSFIQAPSQLITVIAQTLLCLIR